jgi:hypothetical protein
MTVDEHGAEAAAATGVGIVPTSAAARPSSPTTRSPSRSTIGHRGDPVQGRVVDPSTM